MLYKRIPSFETVWEQLSLKEGENPKYIITSDKLRTTYKLWKIVNGGYELLAKGKNPQELEAKMKRINIRKG